MENKIETELIEHQTITAIVENVAIAKTEVQQAFALFKQAKDRLGKTLGGSQYHQIIANGSHYGDSVFDERSQEESMAMITQQAWRYIVDVTGLRHYMTERRQRELNEQITANRLPDLTAENIVSTLQSLSGRIDGLLLESVREVFDWLRPGTDWGVGALKTNHHWQVGRKAIVGWGIDRNYGGGFHITYGDTHFKALGNVFSLLDGKGVQRYPDDFTTRFNEAMKTANAGEKYDDEYFEIKCYGNRRAHITFKRLDLLAKLNQMGGEANQVGAREPFVKTA